MGLLMSTSTMVKILGEPIKVTSKIQSQIMIKFVYIYLEACSNQLAGAC